MKEINPHNSFEKKPLKKASEPDQTVSKNAHIDSQDLKSDYLLKEVAKMLQREQATMNEQLRECMLNSSRRQYTNTVRECDEGIKLIKSLNDAQKTSDPSSKEKCENAILESNNKTLARFFKKAIDSQYQRDLLKLINHPRIPTDLSVQVGQLKFGEFLKSGHILKGVAEMLRREQAMNEQLLNDRGSMLDSSQRQYTNTVRECVDGIKLIKSLNDAQKTSDPSSENAILASKACVTWCSDRRDNFELV